MCVDLLPRWPGCQQPWPTMLLPNASIVTSVGFHSMEKFMQHILTKFFFHIFRNELEIFASPSALESHRFFFSLNLLKAIFRNEKYKVVLQNF